MVSQFIGNRMLRSLTKEIGLGKILTTTSRKAFGDLGR